MVITDTLMVDGNKLKDANSKIIAVVSEVLKPATIYAYSHVFSVSAKLLEYMRSCLKQVNFEQRIPLYGYHPYSTLLTYSGFPDWVKYGLRALAVAEGKEKPHHNYRMMTNTNLHSLFIRGNILIDDIGQIVAVLSQKLEKDIISSYEYAFIASIEILDIIDYKSSCELTHIKNEYAAAQIFNKRENILSDITMLGISPPYLTDDLKKARHLVALAKGKEYVDWE